jgi:hypothetical protein
MDLIKQYLQAKAEEAAAIARRVSLGEQLAKELGAPAEGSKTHHVGAYSVEVNQPINRKVDWETMDKVLAGNPDRPAPVKTKRELDVPGLKWIRENDPGFYACLATAITATPGRVQVTIKEVEK